MPSPRSHPRIREIDRSFTGDVVLTSNTRKVEVEQWLSHPGNLSPGPRPGNAV